MKIVMILLVIVLAVGFFGVSTVNGTHGSCGAEGNSCCDANFHPDCDPGLECNGSNKCVASSIAPPGGGGNPGASCTSNVQCYSPTVCINGICTTQSGGTCGAQNQACCSGTACNSGLTCQGNVCVTIGGGGTCGDKLCSAGEACVQDCGSGTACASAKECAPEEYCLHGACRPRSTAQGEAFSTYDTQTYSSVGYEKGQTGVFRENIPQQVTCAFAATVSSATFGENGEVVINEQPPLGSNIWNVNWNSACSKNPEGIEIDGTRTKNFDETTWVTLENNGADQVALVATNFCGSSVSAKASIKIKSYIPNKGQTCETGELKPICKGTEMSCGFDFCEICAKFSGTNEEGEHIEGATGAYPLGNVVKSCSGAYVVQTQDWEYREFKCPGLYQGCAQVGTGPIESRGKILEFCPRGCMINANQPICKYDNAPIISSISGPAVAKRNDNVQINSSAYDPDTIYDGSVNGTQTSREKIALGCSSISTEAGSGEEFENITFDPDVCEPTFYKFTNPSCTFTVDADASGPIAIYCRAFDGEMWSKEEIPMTIIIDATPPQITVISPDEGAVQRKGFSVNVHDADDTGLASCSYRVLDNGVETKNTTARTCSSPVTITIGVGRDCPTQGSSSCKVEFFAKDTSGNNASASRSFSVEYLYSNITSPPAGSFRRTNFSVSIMDTNTGGGGFSSCEYMVKNIVNNTAETTRDWTVRTCNSPLKLTAGPEADCKEQGNNTCIIYAKAHAQSGSIAIDGEMASRAFSIDYTSPYSEITSPASGVWTNNNFIVQIADYDPSGLGISECEYRVLSNGIETVPFKSRSCNSGVQIILGRDCTEEPQCTVQARAYSVSGNIGALAERNFTVILSNVMLDGFVTPLGAVQSDRGVDFSGTLASSIKMTFPTFRSCPTTASISECKSAFSSTVNNCDQDGNCLCGGLNALSCSARCNDRTAEFYFLATGFSGSKQIDVVSSISSVECPTFNIDELNGWIQLFEEVRQQVFIMKQQAYTLYLQTPNNTDLQYAISKLTEAYGLADNHITNMTIVMQDLTVPKSQSLMQRSVEINQQILGILNSICTQTTICYQPANFTLSIETPLSARLGEQVVVNAVLLKKGTLDTYNKISCSITPPSGPTIFYVTKCTKIPADMQFYMNMTNETIVNASQPGQYSVTCSATNSFINDCSITFPIETKTRTFVSVPPIDSYITSVSQLPPSATNGSSVSIVVNARNPDDFDRFGFASCTFARPCAGASCQRNESVSACERIGANESKDFSVSNVVDTVGTWTLERCVLNVTANTNCALSRTHNTSSINAKVNVTGNPLAIIAITPPSNNPAVNSTALTRITLENFNSSASSAAVDCVYASPSFTAYLNSSDTVIVPPFNFDTHVSGKAAANVSIVANELGVWTLTKCNAYTGSNNDEKEINATFAVGPPLSIISISTPGSLSENSSANATINAANLNSSSVSVYGKCVYLSPSGGRHNVTSQNITISAFNKSSIIISKIVEEPGEWNIERCSLYRYQNAFVEERTVNASFYVGLPISINSVITPSSVEVGAHAVTSIYVKNSKSIPLMVVANCLYRTPLFVGKNVLSLNATIPGRGGNITNVSYTVNETGIWNVISCSISLVNGAQQDEKFPNAQFAVGLPPAVCGNGQCELNETVTTCSQDCRTSHVVCGNGQCEATETSASCGIDCSSNACTTNADTPGTDDRCKCQNSVVVACPVGYMCVSHKCETTAPPPECAIDSDCRGGEICENNACIQAQSCSSRIDCTDGRVCLSGKCASASTSQCTSSSDCPSDKICESGVCTPQPIQPQGIDSGVIFFIIIIIAVITIPIIIFTYLRRTVDEI